jgi:hypothetical protein
MTAQGVRGLLRSSEWQPSNSATNQVIFLCEFAETDTTSTLPTEDIGTIFNIRAGNVNYAVRLALNVFHSGRLNQSNRGCVK